MEGSLSWGPEGKGLVCVWLMVKRREQGTACHLNVGNSVVHLCLGWEEETVRGERKRWKPMLEIGSVEGQWPGREILPSQGLLLSSMSWVTTGGP